MSKRGLGTILIVEPHCDDAYLSLGWHIERVWKDWDRIILTVYSTEKRSREARTYANRVGATPITMDLPETKMMAKVSKEYLSETIPELIDTVGQIGADLIVYPLGLQHPDHIRVANSRPSNCLRYVDMPYASKMKLGEEVYNRSVGMTVESIYFPPKTKYRHSSIFATQAKFFHFNPIQDWKLPEIVLRAS